MSTRVVVYLVQFMKVRVSFVGQQFTQRPPSAVVRMQLAIKARMKRVSNKLCPALEEVMKTSAHGSIVEYRDDEPPLQFCVVLWKELYGLAENYFTLVRICRRKFERLVYEPGE